MKKISILLVLLATPHVHGVRKNSASIHSLEELCTQQIATKELRLQKSEEKLQELKDSGADHAKIKALRGHMAKRRSSLQLYKAELEALTDSQNQADSGLADKTENKDCAKRANACCKKHYPDLVMGSLYATLACAIAVEMLNRHC